VIDRHARDEAALLLRRFAAGRLTNDEFDEAFPPSATDSALMALEGRAWHLYSDHREHRLVLDRIGRREVARWVLFLHSTFEYQWPKFQWYQTRGGLWNWLTRGAADRRSDEAFDAFRQSGDYAVWPFLRATDFEEARKRPRFLAGSVSG